jgi:hypothetical protein
METEEEEEYIPWEEAKGYDECEEFMWWRKKYGKKDWKEEDWADKRKEWLDNEVTCVLTSLLSMSRVF